MALQINKTESNIRLVLTLGEAVQADAYTLSLTSHFTGQTSVLPLGENVSPHKGRYDEFSLSKELFINVEDGRYTYRVMAGNEEAEVGLAIVSSESPDFSDDFSFDFSVDDDYLSVTNSGTDDGFVTL